MPSERDKTRRRCQFSLRELLLLAAIVALLAAWWVAHRELLLLRDEVRKQSHADGIYTVGRLVEEAEKSSNGEDKRELIEAAQLAVHLIEGPSYLPGNGRPNDEFSALVERILIVRRGLEQDRRLSEALPAIRKAREEGNVEKAAEITRLLVSEYPDLVNDDRLTVGRD